MVLVLVVTLCVNAIAAERKPVKADTAPDKGKVIVEPSQVGRYQLLQGKYNETNSITSDHSKSEGLFLLDTVTGSLLLCNLSIYPNTASGHAGTFLSKRTCEPFEEQFEISHETVKRMLEMKSQYLQTK